MTRPGANSGAAGAAGASAAPCDRFEREGLLRLEQGLPLDPHFDTCERCLAARAEYEWLQGGMRDLDRTQTGRTQTGRTDWQARAWAGIARAEERRAPWRRWRTWLLAAPLAAAAAAVLVLVLSGRGTEHEGPLLAYAVRAPAPGAEPMRGGHARPGDVLDVQASTGGAVHAELRVYRDGGRDDGGAGQALLVRCTDQAPCSRRGDDIAASVRLDQRGHYWLVFLHGPQPLPAPGASLDDDLARARAAGAAIEQRELDVL
jgi:hypothetical protein